MNSKFRILNSLSADPPREVQRDLPQADASRSALEGEIDQLVYQLYGLSQEEIDIVEGKK
jgi:hypothetical protein